MKATEYLRQYEEANKRASRLKAEYELELEKIDAVRSPMGGDGMPHGNGINKSVENKAIELADKATAWKEAELDAIRLRQEVFDVVHGVEGLPGEVLYQRYVNLLKWSDVCTVVNKSWNATHSAHRRGLAIVQSIIEVPGR